MGGYDDDDVGKDWARKYLLDPLHEPEPSQLCGPGSSFITPSGIQRSISVQAKPSKTKPAPTRPAPRTTRSTNSNKPLPTPPASSSPTQSRFRPSRPSNSNPFTSREDPEDVKRLHSVLVRSQSVTEGRNRSVYRPSRDIPPSASLNRSKTVHTAQPRETRWNQGTILARQDSYSSSSRRPETPNSQRGPRSPSSIVASPVSSPLTSPLASPTQMASPVARNMDSDKGKGLRRSGSLSARYPGDMSHRPLDTIKQEQKAAMKAPYLHNPRHKQPADLVDTLDQSGFVDAPYHHEGPYDATMANRNRKKMYSPLDAVKDSNEEAIRATPREYIQDSLTKHVPLQGTAVIPPGMRDMSGRTMEYQEGADLMRESDAPGGAYKRYEGIVSGTTSAGQQTSTRNPNPVNVQSSRSYPYCPSMVSLGADKTGQPQRYLDDDLKGKGEPSYTIERDRKEEKARLRRQAGNMGEGGSQVYEMQPRTNTNTTTNHGHGRGSGSGSSSARKSDGGPVVRHRSVSNADETGTGGGPSSPLMRHDSRDEQGGSAYATNSDLRHRDTTGHKFAEGLKKRFGSLRKKKGSDERY